MGMVAPQQRIASAFVVFCGWLRRCQRPGLRTGRLSAAALSGSGLGLVQVEGDALAAE
jgi:hypothetical protein